MFWELTKQFGYLNDIYDMSTPSWIAAILDTASKVLPLVVAISGRVGSDTPLICQQSGMRGVIVEETVTTEFICSLVCGDKYTGCNKYTISS